MPASERAAGEAQGLPRAWGGGDVLGIFRDSARPVGSQAVTRGQPPPGSLVTERTDVLAQPAPLTWQAGGRGAVRAGSSGCRWGGRGLWETDH